MPKYEKQLAGLLSGLLLAAVVSTAPAVFAQTTSGDLTGTVIDPAGMVIPSAAVNATNDATGIKTATVSGGDGVYHLENLPVGTYTISATVNGFAPASVSGVQIELNHATTVNIPMKVGTVTSEVQVIEAPAIIDTSTAQLQTSFDSRQMESLSMASSGSGVINLSLLQAGVATGGAVGVGTGPSVGGQRPRNNNFTVEGVDNNNKAISGPLVQIPNDAVSEFTVLTNQFSPEYGHSSGGQFNQVVKSGTNQFHGMAYEYFINRDLNAADNLNYIQGIPLHPRYDNNRFGGNVGGPIKKNKLFFFVDWEYAPVGQTASTVNEVPTAAGYSLLAGMPGIDTTNLQQFQKYLGTASSSDYTAYANPNLYFGGGASAFQANGALVPGTVLIPMGQVGSSLPNYQNTNSAVTSIDLSISNADQLRGRFIMERQGLSDTSGFPAAFFTTLPYNYYLVTVSEYHTFTPNLVNELRLGFNRYSNTYSVPNISFPGLDQFPNIDVYEGVGSAFGPDPNAPQYGIQNGYQLNDGLTWNKGRHSLKFGFDGFSWISPQSFVQRSRGDYEYDYLSDYMFDYYPDYIAQRSLGGQEYSGNQYLFGIYGNDSFKLRPNLTINIGLRWEYETVPLGEQLQTLNSVSNVPGLITFGKPTAQKDAFMPRIGIAYSPGTSGKTSFRAGFGESYDVLPDNFGLLTEPPQFTTTVDCTGGPTTGCNAAGGPGAGFLANGGIKPNSSVAALSVADLRAGTGGYVPNQERPKSIQWNFGVQHVFAQNYTFESNYIGTRGLFLPVQEQINRQPVVNASNALPLFYTAPSQATLNSLTSTLSSLTAQLAAGGNVIPAYLNAGFTGIITSYQPWGNSNYEGLANTLTRRFSNGLQMIGAYTWSHNIDDSTAEVFSTYTTPRRAENGQDLAADRSSSALDHRQRFSLAVVYDVTAFRHSNWFMRNVVSNWQVAPVYQYQSGTLYTVQSGVDSNLNGDSAGDRTFVNPNGVAGTGSGATPLLNSAGQTVAYLATNPDAQYIAAPKGTLPNGGRNTGQLRPIDDIDFTLAKNFNVTERYRVQIALRAFNLLNHPQYVGSPISDVLPAGTASPGLNSSTTSAAVHNFLIPGSSIFGDPTQAFSSNPRSVQLSMKFTF